VLQIAVKDTGIGMPKDRQDSIYEKFTRLTPSNKGKYKGSGLGLSVVKQLIEEINAEIDVHSELNKGTTFICTIPFELPLVDNVLFDN
jgi:two-component system aerobic respiration control sensor histidine kinase ArcB